RPAGCAARTKSSFADRKLFFFSSRRRHTRSKRDWSSDVCSSDLQNEGVLAFCLEGRVVTEHVPVTGSHSLFHLSLAVGHTALHRSEERRVGKDCRSRWGPDPCQKRDQSSADAVRVMRPRTDATVE